MDPLDTIIAAEERDCMHAAINRLPEMDRIILKLVDIESLTVEETAGCLAMRHAQVRKALEKARAMLKARLAV